MTSFGRFRIIGELGRGGMGVVFRGYDPDMGREVAIKVLRADAALGSAELDDVRARFDREAQAAGGLNHPGIVAHYERGEIEGNRFIVMEFVEGRPLHALMEGPRPSLAESLAILRQMASALDYAHGRGVIHRDVKPANVLVQADGTVKIADFGIAKCSTVAGHATSSSVVIGSPHYMAPEQIEARPVDGRTDQWALAVTAYELLTGAKPFQADSVVNLFQRILSDPAPDPRAHDPSVPVAARPVFSRALSKATEGRFETCSAFVEALANAVLPAAADGRAPGKEHRAVVRIRPGWLAGAIAFIVLFAAVLWSITSRLGDVPADRKVREAAAGGARRAGDVRRNERTGLDYVWIATGSFLMGCSTDDTGCGKDETAHEVALTRSFWLGRTEVTVGAFKLFCQTAGGHLPPAPAFNPDWSNGNLPVSSVTWKEASRFCAWAEGRLPTEAEWEFAARGGVPGARYENLERIAWTRENSDLRAREVGTLQPNRYGLFDVLGNVWEWTADRYDENYYSRSPRADPAGPEDGNFRVLRGGSWVRGAAAVRVSHRYPVLPVDPDYAVGFRCAADEMP